MRSSKSNHHSSLGRCGRLDVFDETTTLFNKWILDATYPSYPSYPSRIKRIKRISCIQNENIISFSKSSITTKHPKYPNDEN